MSPPLRLAVAAASLLAACGPPAAAPEAEYYTSHGFAVLAPDGVAPAPEEVELATEIALAHLASNFPALYDRAETIAAQELQPVLIEVHDGPIFVDGVQVRGSYANVDNRIRYRHAPCLGQTPISHELVHYYNWIVEGVFDDRHQRSAFFGSGSIESTTWGSLIDELCPGATPL